MAVTPRGGVVLFSPAAPTPDGEGGFACPEPAVRGRGGPGPNGRPVLTVRGAAATVWPRTQGRSGVTEERPMTLITIIDTEASDGGGHARPGPSHLPGRRRPSPRGPGLGAQAVRPVPGQHVRPGPRRRRPPGRWAARPGGGGRGPRPPGGGGRRSRADGRGPVGRAPAPGAGGPACPTVRAPRRRRGPPRSGRVGRTEEGPGHVLQLVRMPVRPAGWQALHDELSPTASPSSPWPSTSRPRTCGPGRRGSPCRSSTTPSTC